MTDKPFFAAPLYGLRTWTVVGPRGEERLTGPQQHTPWPDGGEWLDAVCALSREHAPPARDCSCGIHALHPTRQAARRVLASRRVVPGILEASGAIAVHEDGFRAESARPYALFLLPGRNAGLVRRLAEAYRVEVLEASGQDDLLEFTRERGLGLDEGTVADLIGPARFESARQARRGRLRADVLRGVAAVVIASLLVIGGLTFAPDPPGERVLKGRAGEVRVGEK